MRIKSYYAETVQAAMRLARQELGPDAMLMKSRKAPEEFRHLGAYEVVFGVAGAMKARTPVSDAAPDRSVHDSIAELRQELRDIRNALCSGHRDDNVLRTEPGAAEILSGLIESEVEPQLARDILSRSTDRDADAADASARSVIQECIGVAPTLGSRDCRIQAAVFLGPPGAGKTASLIKLAIGQGIGQGRRPRLVSVLPRRVAASEELRLQADILGADCEIVENAGDLARVLEASLPEELVLLDTPGLTDAEGETADELSRLLASYTALDRHLVVSAASKPADLRRTIDYFERFRPGKLLFTRLDETRAAGCLLNEAFRTQKPISFLAAGQRVPEDILAADRTTIAELILPPRYRQARSAA